MYRVGIDGRSLFSGQRTGVTRILWNLLGHLFRNDHGIEFYLYTSDLESGFDLPEGWLGVRLRRLGSRFFRQKRLWEQIILPRGLRRDGIDICFFPNYILPIKTPCRTLLLIHDISYEVHPEWFPSLKSRYIRWFSRMGADKADHILTVSEFSRNEIIRCYGVKPDKVSKVYWAPEPKFYQEVSPEETSRVRKKYGIEGEYVLYVGSLHKRRQIPELLAAVAGKPGKEPVGRTLVMVGHNNFRPRVGITDLIHEAGADKVARYLDFVPEEDLLPLYAGADIVAYISQYEGFGLPVVEGMACRKPVVTSDVGALREVSGNGAVMVDPENVDEIRDAFHRLATDRAYHNEMSERGFKRSLEFSWDKCAEDFLAIVKNLLGGKD